MPTTRIQKIGLEVEGAWNPRAGVDPKHDGSIRGLGNRGLHVGELASAPLESLELAEAWLKDKYPDAVNDTCGFHVHVSLKPLHYSRIMHESFGLCFLNAMEDFWSRFRSEPGFDLFRQRLDGQNEYCQKIFRPEQQLFRREAYGDRATLPRYSQLNYCWSRHGTMECRLFPCFPKVGHAVEALRVFTNCIDAYLNTCQPEKPISVQVLAETASSGR